MYPIKYYLNTDYQEMEVLGVKGLFTNLRVERDSLPEGFYKYSLREDDEEYFSSVENDVLVNHSGDFICKSELSLGEDGCKDIGEDYNFTDEPVNLDEFFGVDIKTKIAEALDEFMREYDPYEYADNLNAGQANMVDEVRAMLDTREQSEGILKELKEIYKENKNSFDAETVTLLNSLIDAVDENVCSFPEKRPVLDSQIKAAELLKVKTPEDDGQLEPTVDEP